MGYITIPGEIPVRIVNQKRPQWGWVFINRCGSVRLWHQEFQNRLQPRYELKHRCDFVRMSYQESQRILHPWCELIYRCDFIRLCYQESQGSLQHCCGINYKLVSSGCVIWHWNPRARSLHPSRGITYRCDCDKIHSTTWIYTKDISPTMIVSSAYWWWETWSLIEELGKRISSLGDDNSKCKKNEICLATEYHRLQIFQIQIAELTLCDCKAA